jgi:hypothetical protein
MPMTARPSTAAPILAMLAIVLVTLGATIVRPSVADERALFSFDALEVGENGTVLCGITQHLSTRHVRRTVVLEKESSDSVVIPDFAEPQFLKDHNQLIGLSFIGTFARTARFVLFDLRKRKSTPLPLDFQGISGDALAVDGFSVLAGSNEVISCVGRRRGGVVENYEPFIASFNAETGKPRRICELGDGRLEVEHLAASSHASGRVVVSACEWRGESPRDGRIRSIFVRAARSGEPVSMLGIENEQLDIEAIDISPDGAWVALTTRKYDDVEERIECQLWNARKGTLVAGHLSELLHRYTEKAPLREERRAIVGFSPDSKRVAFALDDSWIRVYSVPDGRLLGDVSCKGEKFVVVRFGTGGSIYGGTDEPLLWRWKSVNNHYPDRIASLRTHFE